MGALAARALEGPEEPWLFHRPEWTWRWRSYQQVADQVARGAAGLRTDRAAPTNLAVKVRQHPDAVANLLAIQAAGRIPLAGAGPGDEAPADIETWAEVASGVPEEGRRSYLLPRCHDALEVWQPLDLKPAGASGAFVMVNRERRTVHTEDDLKGAALRLEATLEDLDLATSGGRPILSTGPLLDPYHAQVVLTWCLWNAAAWVLEPAPEAFVAAVRWARPTVVMATVAEVLQLAAELGESRQVKRWRLRAVVALGVGESEKASRQWQALGVEFRHLDLLPG